MNITRENIDDLNAILKVDIEKKDYQDKVEKILSDYRKSANIPGFRKGHVPMGMVKKQYGKAVLIDEVNKLLQDALGKYLVEEKLDVLGNPLPKSQEHLDWNSDDFSFEFELGLAPQFEVKLNGKKAITHYKIVADKKMIDSQIENIQKQFGKLVSKEVVEEGDEISGVFSNTENEIENSVSLDLDKVKGKTNLKKFLGLKAGDTVKLKTKGLFNDDHDLIHYLKVSHDQVHDLNIEVEFKVSEINKRELADMDQELFDKLYGPDQIKTVTEL
ncbi:MAG: trigger factor, partial [Flavobacteriaceae bacterium]|nr:trigger factor [Flavobacteriaceae bacterium]